MEAFFFRDRFAHLKGKPNESMIMLDFVKYCVMHRGEAADYFRNLKRRGVPHGVPLLRTAIDNPFTIGQGG